jgi:Leucine-rich repeat (LRR) protein
MSVVVAFCLLTLSASAVTVTFNSAPLEQAVRNALIDLGADPGPTIEDTELVGVGFTQLTASGLAIDDLEGLQYCTDLQALDLSNNAITSISQLSSLTNLQSLRLHLNQISDISPLSGLTSLLYLDLGFGNPLEGLDAIDPGTSSANQLTDLSALSGLTNLAYLNVAGNGGVTDLSPLSGLTSLQALWVGGSASLTDLSPITSLPNLGLLGVVNAGIEETDLNGITSLPNLQLLALVLLPNITDLSGLSGLDLMGILFVGLPVSDISVVANWTNLSAAIITSTAVADVSPLGGLTGLTLLNLTNNLITDISPLATLTGLESLDLSGNQIADISALEGLVNLQSLGIALNQVTDLTALINNTGLGEDDQVDISDNPLTTEAICDQLPLLIAKFNNPSNVIHNYTCEILRTLTINVIGTGTVDPGAGTFQYPDGTLVTVTASPSDGSGFAFDRFEGAVNTTQNSVQILMDEDKSLDVFFVPGDFTLTVTHSGAGTGVTSPPVGVFSYLAGRSVPISARPDFGSYFGGWSGDIPQSPFELDQVLVMNEDKAVEASFEDSGWNLTVVVVGIGFTAPAPGTYGFIDGAEVPLHAIESPGHPFVQWAQDISSIDPNTTVTMDGNKVVVAVFTNGYRLTIYPVVGSGVVSPPPGSYLFSPGVDVSIQATANPGHLFDHWEGDIGEADPFNPSLVVTMDQDRGVTAFFVPITHTLTISVVGSGTTSPPPGTYTFIEGATATVAAVPDTGWLFDHWEGDIGGEDPNNPMIHPLMDQDRTITAVFVPIQYTLTISVNGNGTTDPAPGSYLYNSGQNVPLVAIPDEGYQFDHWEGDIGPANPNDAAIIVRMDQDRSVTAFFVPIPEGTPEGTPEGVVEGTPEGVVEGTPEGVTEGEGTTSSQHSADQDGDFRINLSELLRVIQFFNSGGYHCQTGTEDGYAPGLAGDQTCAPHSSDYNPQDWRISLSELLRVIQFFNSGGYHPCAEGEDGFCPGP